MKQVSLYVAEEAYAEIREMAKRRGRPLAELVREAMEEYVRRERRSGQSLRDLPAHASGKMRKGWTRSEVLDEMLER